eukprot:6460061-Amphidinium_carterae.1
MRKSSVQEDPLQRDIPHHQHLLNIKPLVRRPLGLQEKSLVRGLPFAKTKPFCTGKPPLQRDISIINAHPLDKERLVQEAPM